MYIVQDVLVKGGGGISLFVSKYFVSSEMFDLYLVN